ncbi:MmgE/PrpD family protein [Neorhizobium sp. NCHU2750]|uniref:MmgE/PrpD family protein n=1 Tax=Neorhizobium sp. NCHU2750 TaxID=1825976 RepID=UPI000E765AF4|nr:protein involved in propionate catabolism [Neorhizobium sp. NCHU2750]
MQSVTLDLAERFARPVISDEVRQDAIRAITDLIGVALAGSRTLGGIASLGSIAEIWGDGPAPIWFCDRSTTVAGAAFVNASFAAALDLDDGHRMAAGHPGAAIIPALLAASLLPDADQDRLLDAIIIGYEISVRIAAARDIGRLKTTDSGLWCGYGVAAGIAHLRHLSPWVSSNAMAIAGQTSTGQAGTGWTKVGHTVKEGIPWAAANGVMAVSLALRGHLGPTDLLDDDRVYARRTLSEGVATGWAVSNLYFKRYSCCRWGHAAIDAAIMLKTRHGLVADLIETIEIATFSRALSLPNQGRPLNLEGAQYSIPFCVALALCHGPDALLPLTERHLSDARVLSLSDRVRLVEDDRYLECFPTTTPALLTITAGGHRFQCEVTHPYGEAKNPFNAYDLRDKFLRLGKGYRDEAMPTLLKSIDDLGARSQAADNIKSFHRAITRGFQGE